MARQLKYNLNNRVLTIENMLVDKIDFQDSDVAVFTYASGATATATSSVRKIAEFSKLSYGSAKFVIQATDKITDDKMVTEVLLFCDSDSVDITEYATLFSSSSRFVDFSSVINGSLCELRSQTTSANQTEFKINLTLIRN
jgi:hypothetical protein